jgi:hypothetical protein
MRYPRYIAFMGKMLYAVRAALRGRESKDPRDAAAERVALGYAELIDAAAPAARYRKALAVISRALSGASLEADDPYEAFQAVATALAEHTVTSDLGPKLLSTLDALGLTTKARGTGTDERGAGGAAKPANPLDELRARRARRTAG